ncbi:alpha/beta hydrolase [Leisingera sp.]|uniref:alpha/beta fold hydrolase n=1 Tax=Leisingera sp. TaxID=1879318 RepID=UPI002B26E1DF|nr:alpha/beta hydrolase [Leisingera sp.]
MHAQNRKIITEGAALHVQEQGDPAGPPLLFLHGGGGSLQDLAGLLPYFGGYRCVLMDSRGHGGSALGDLPLTYPQLARDAEAVIAACGLEAPVLVGYSDGGIAALHAAAAGRVRLGGIVTMAANGSPPSAQVIETIYATVTASGWREMFPVSSALYDRINPAPDLERLLSELGKLWCNTDPGNYPDAARLARISCPALVLGGDSDRLVPRAETLALAEGIAGAALGLLPFAGHDFPETAPKATAAAVQQFLAQLPQT